MSKILKRTFALALVFCMLLSVIPAASAETATAEYIFTNATNVKTNTLYGYDDRETNPNEWYYLSESNQSSSSSCVKSNTQGLSIGWTSSTYGTSHWIALALEMTAGTYDMSTIYGNFPTGNDLQIAWFKATADQITTVRDYTGQYKSGDIYNMCTDSVLLNQQFGYNKVLNNGTVGTRTAAYLGEFTFETGTYVFLFRGRKADNSTSNAVQARIEGLYFTEAEKDGAALDYLSKKVVNNADKGYVQIADDYDCSAADVVLYEYIHNANSKWRPNIDLMGNTLTCKSFTGIYGSTVIDSVGTGGIVATDSAPLLASNQSSVAVYLGNNKYALTEVTKATKVTPVVVDAQDDYTSGDTARFVFKISLSEQALAGIAAYDKTTFPEEARLEIGANWKQGENTLTPTVFKNEDIVTWATGTNSADKVFYIDVTGMDKLAEGETVTCTPYIKVGNITTYLTPITYTAAAAAA